jgi:uncharacterized protein
LTANEPTRKKKEHVISYIQSRSSRLIVALSGGVDSAVLLWLAVEALGLDNVLAVTGGSDSVSAEDLQDAREVAGYLGANWKILKTNEMERAGYQANAGDRCFHCRAELFEVLGGYASEHGYDAVAYGAILDDTGDFRPGMDAAAQAGALAPLLEGRLSKDDVRELAGQAGLPVKDKPAAACLSSRIPVGSMVTPERLAQVGEAEKMLRKLGFVQFRVRHHDEIARLELDQEGDRLIRDDDVRRQAVAAVKAAGFRFVAVDLEGYRTGSLNPEPPESGKLYRIGPASESGQ